ncbi:MAG: DUF2029 domain-containing protein [Chloroflexota bacterium]|nr:DUF2029 domain-containing protein [Chloroflexota bacterium]
MAPDRPALAQGSGGGARGDTLVSYSHRVRAARVRALMVRALTPNRKRALRHGLLLTGLGYGLVPAVILALTAPEALGYDALSYWSIDLTHLYRGTIGDAGWFPYSPALAMVASPLGVLPWPVFLGLWLALLLATVLWLGGRRTIWLLAFPPVAVELCYGNINLLLAAALVLGFRYPAAWAFVLLSKVTPGVGLLWFVVRREWRPLGIAVGVTLVLAAASFAAAPHLWLEWRLVLAASSAAVPDAPFNAPLLIRLPLAAALVIWGARTDRAWTVPAAATLAMPVLWFAALSTLCAVVPLVRDGIRPPGAAPPPAAARRPVAAPART